MGKAIGCLAGPSEAGATINAARTRSRMRTITAYILHGGRSWLNKAIPVIS